MGIPRFGAAGSARAFAWLWAAAASVAGVAQQPALELVIVPGRTEVRLDGALPGAVVVWFADVAAGRAPLPGGASLGLAAPVIAGVTFADPRGIARFAVAFPVGAHAGSTLLAQAVAWNLALPLGDAAALSLTAVERATVPVPGAFADIHVLFGQSNAEGHAEAALLPPRLQGPHPRCRIWNDAAGEFQAMEVGINTLTYGQPTWCGPEATLGEGLTAAGDTIYLVKCAFAMTALGPTPGPWNEWGLLAAELYAILRFRIDRACAAARADGLTPRIGGIFMMQGESDATDAAQAGVYANLLTTLVVGMRRDLVAAGLAVAVPPIPFVIGGIDAALPAGSFPYAPIVRDAQRRVAAATPGCAWVDTRSFGLRSDGVHFDTAGVMALGAAMAAAWRGL